MITPYTSVLPSSTVTCIFCFSLVHDLDYFNVITCFHTTIYVVAIVIVIANNGLMFTLHTLLSYNMSY